MAAAKPAGPANEPSDPEAIRATDTLTVATPNPDFAVPPMGKASAPLEQEQAHLEEMRREAVRQEERQQAQESQHVAQPGKGERRDALQADLDQQPGGRPQKGNQQRQPDGFATGDFRHDLIQR